MAIRNYFANLNAFEFVFTTSGPAAESTEISVWGKNESGKLVTTHRLVTDELLGSEMAGPQGKGQGPNRSSIDQSQLCSKSGQRQRVINGATNTVFATITVGMSQAV